LLTIATAIGKASAGDTVYMRGGLYTYTAQISISKSGNATNRMQLWAYPGEKPLLDFSGEALGKKGISLTGSYWHVKGISIKGAGDNGFYISGAFNIIEFCEFYENRDSGLQLSGGANNNKIINCDSYYNADPTDYGDADGFAVKMDVGTKNYFYGCRSWMNVDDGWDGYLRGANGMTTTLENCWTWRNGYFKNGTDAGANANGNGFKMGGSDTANLQHNFILKNCLSFNNKAKGFDQNNNKGSMTLYNCTGYGNIGYDYSIPTALAAGFTCTITNCVDLGSSKTKLGTFVIQTTNSWQSPFVVASNDFITIDSAGVSGPRQADGSLPLLSYMHLAPGSDLIDGGTNVGTPFNGSKPDLGAWETGNYNVVTDVMGSGYVLLNPAGGVYAPGTLVILTAVPKSGNIFSDWSGDFVSTQPSTQITLNTDIAVTANFQIASGIHTALEITYGISCSPTVVGENVLLDIVHSRSEKMRILVYSASGKPALDLGEMQMFAGKNSKDINLGHLISGIYVIIVKSNTTLYQSKFIKK
jgi:hypothetical protein